MDYRKSTSRSATKSKTSLKITGYAAVFYRANDPKTEYEIFPGGFERIMPTAFDSASKRRDDVRGLFNHDANLVLGRTYASTMTLRKTAIGLEYTIEPSQTTLYSDVAEMLRRGDLSGSSFSFLVLKEVWKTENGREIRELRDLKLFDVGPVTFPAYAGATATARSADEVARLERQLYLRSLDMRSIEGA